MARLEARAETLVFLFQQAKERGFLFGALQNTQEHFKS